MRRPNVVFIFADEWRAQATGYNGDPNCETPVLDALAGESLNLSHAVSGIPVCCPYRGCLMTGQYPLTHGVFINDVELDPDCQSIARAFKAGGYETGYIGKWHLYGSPKGTCERRSIPVPRSHQLGFDHWWGFECCHNYWESPYYYNDEPEKHMWEGYDAFGQSELAADFIRRRAGRDEPYMMMLSWGPPHFPLHTAPDEYKARYTDRDIVLPPNVPAELRTEATEELRGYYAHIAALDDALATVLTAIKESGQEDDTLLIVTADHGDMMRSQGLEHKLYAFDESLRVPFLLRWPAMRGREAADLPLPIDSPDLMPTLLSLCDCDIPASVQGTDWSAQIRGDIPLTGEEDALIGVPAASTWLVWRGLQPYRGLRTRRYTYTRNLDGPEFLFDNEVDPYQMCNLIDQPEHAALQAELETRLQTRLAAIGDEFLPGEVYLERAGLNHYREVQGEVRDQWTYPWGN